VFFNDSVCTSFVKAAFIPATDRVSLTILMFFENIPVKQRFFLEGG
jgi:hypothetical protein